MSWSERQHGMLAAMGLGHWPIALGQQPQATTPQAAPSEAARADAPPVVMPVVMPMVHPAPQAPARADWPDLPAVHAAAQACNACGLCEGRRQAVPGTGHPHAHWMVVGEAPGEQEDQQGEPFVGPSGRLLDAMLAAIGLTREAAEPARQVYITNTVKCRPPGNRNPSPQELAACAPFLQRQLALVKPRMVLALGRFAVQSLLGVEEPIGRLRGRVHSLPDGTPVVVSYHPSYLLRQPLEKAKAWADLCLAAAWSEKAHGAVNGD